MYRGVGSDGARKLCDYSIDLTMSERRITWRPRSMPPNSRHQETAGNSSKSSRSCKSSLRLRHEAVSCSSRCVTQESQSRDQCGVAGSLDHSWLSASEVTTRYSLENYLSVQPQDGIEEFQTCTKCCTLLTSAQILPRIMILHLIRKI
jgi:hypothetical protein